MKTCFFNLISSARLICADSLCLKSGYRCFMFLNKTKPMKTAMSMMPIAIARSSAPVPSIKEVFPISASVRCAMLCTSVFSNQSRLRIYYNMARIPCQYLIHKKSIFPKSHINVFFAHPLCRFYVRLCRDGQNTRQVLRLQPL